MTRRFRLSIANVPPAPPASPVLTREGTLFKLDGVAIKRFGLRAVNALQDDTRAQSLIDGLDTILAHGMQSVVLNLQGGRFESEGNSAFNGFNADGSLKTAFADRLETILDAIEAREMVAVVQCFYRGKDEELTDDNAVRAAVSATVALCEPWRNLWLHIINEPGHSDYDHTILTGSAGQIELYELAKDADPDRIVHVNTPAGANDGFNADTMGRGGITNPPSEGDVSVEYIRYDEYLTPGEFLSADRTTTETDITAAFNANAYFFYHAAWHQKADAVGFPKFEKGGAGTSADPGVSFAWDTMNGLES